MLDEEMVAVYDWLRVNEKRIGRAESERLRGILKDLGGKINKLEREMYVRFPAIDRNTGL